MKYMIIGASIAGINAVEAIRRYDRYGGIAVISEETDPPYSRPLISYWLAACARVTSGPEMLYRPRGFYEKHNVNLIMGKRAVRLDPAVGTVRLNTGEVLEYENLLLACGGKSIIPPGLAGVPYHTFYSWEDVREIAARIRAKGPGQHALVIGGGLIGMKAAESLRMLGVEVTVVDLAGHILSSILPPAAGKFLENLLSHDRKLHFYLNTTATGIKTEKEKSRCEILGVSITFDHLILAVGLRPNLELCQGTPIKTNKGVLVDERMQTSLPHHYAAGDLAETPDPAGGEKKAAAILPNAAAQGQVAGAAMTGADTVLERHTVFNSLNLFTHSLVTIGSTTGDTDSVSEINSLDQYSQFFYRKQRLCGAVLLARANLPERSGIYRYLIEKQIKLKKPGFIKAELLALPEAVRLDLGLI